MSGVRRFAPWGLWFGGALGLLAAVLIGVDVLMRKAHARPNGGERDGGQECGGGRGARRGDGVQGREVGRGVCECIEQGDEDRRHGEEAGDAVGFDPPGENAGIELFHQEHVATGLETAESHRCTAGGVEQRHEVRVDR